MARRKEMTWRQEREKRQTESESKAENDCKARARHRVRRLQAECATKALRGGGKVRQKRG
jgi:hypothetical protein